MEINPEVKELLKQVLTLLDDGATPSEDPPEKLPLLKYEQCTDSKLQVIEVMYCPPEIEIRKMVANFNANINNIKGNLGHIKNTDKFKPVMAWVNEVECMIGDNYISEGTPLVKIQFYDAELYQKRKEGQMMGLSIGAMGRTVTKE